MAAERLVVLGGGESGIGAAILGQQKGFEVFVSDQGTITEKYKKVLLHNEIAFEEKGHTPENVLNADEVVKSPGIQDTAEIVIQLKEKGIPVISEIEFAGRYTNAKMVCITGSNGKTTTTMLVHHILQKAGFNAKLAGNVGKSLAWQVAEHFLSPVGRVGEGQEGLIYVVELSSFQLDNMYDFKADVAILLNITPDHLDRYNNSMEEYAQSKFRIIQNQGEEDAFIYCADDQLITEIISQKQITMKQYPFSIKKEVEEGAYKNNTELIININHKPMSMSILKIALQGNHNLYNTMAATIAGRVLEVNNDVIRESLIDFQNIEHRMEFVNTVHGIDFINDSKGTNVNAAWYALESAKGKVVWIAGGVDKGNDYSILEDIVAEKVDTLICLGKDNKKLKKAFEGKVANIVEADSMEKAVALGYEYGRNADTVLLSPACASFDLFENYEDRGQQFKTAVRAL